MSDNQFTNFIKRIYLSNRYFYVLVLIAISISILVIVALTFQEQQDQVQLILEDELEQLKFQFTGFLNQYNKGYKTALQFKSGLSNFQKNKVSIEQLNKGSKGDLVLGLNQFSDQSLETFKSKILKLQSPSEQYRGQQLNNQNTDTLNQSQPNTTSTTNAINKNTKNIASNESPLQTPLIQLPANFDWRTKGVVTPIKDQQSCGSCYSFASTAVIESILLIKDPVKNFKIDLSEQQLIDCSFAVGNNGCNGGHMTNVYYYLQDIKLVSEDYYPYTAMEEICRASLIPSGVLNIKEFYQGSSSNSTYIKGLLMKNPLAIGISGNSDIFRFYKKGIISSSLCGTNIDHAVVLVGWGQQDKTTNYWIIKNSFGTSWGENGYAKILMENKTNSICGIGKDITYPILR
ncbi:cathepsin l [Stylonychia lemnae]|uniref:Cathepsin l n=1 Tax=Stylonychia lemnae TaxID=5949 RepID=A0A077ZPH7_STYLE|nr:cathepsin l [Stylonychia lemnae]|eukprot:CDW71295.1 cathepsin l [Stylonychia lemnae]